MAPFPTHHLFSQLTCICVLTAPPPLPQASHSHTIPFTICARLSPSSLMTIYAQHHTSMSPPWLELMLKQCGLFMKVESRREQLMVWEGPDPPLILHTWIRWRFLPWQQLHCTLVKVKGGHLTFPYDQVLWPQSLGKKPWWGWSLSTGISNWASLRDFCRVRPYAPTFPQSKDLKHKEGPHLAANSLPEVLDPMGFP